jgi:rhodanese-related sulfurtransferase
MVALYPSLRVSILSLLLAVNSLHHQEHGFPKPLPQQKIIFYCRSGKRSATACELAGEAGYKNVRNYEGSWLDWTKKEQEAQAAGFKDDDED